MLQWLLEVNAKRLCDTHLLLLRLEIVFTLVEVSLQQKNRDILKHFLYMGSHTKNPGENPNTGLISYERHWLTSAPNLK